MFYVPTMSVWYFSMNKLSIVNNASERRAAQDETKVEEGERRRGSQGEGKGVVREKKLV